MVYSLAEASRVVGVAPNTLRKEIREGRLRAARIGKGGVGRVYWKISREDLQVWWKSRGGGILPRGEK